MSADNWTYCPRCTVDQERAREKRRKNVEAKYGKVPATEYLAAVKELNDNPPKREETFREDFSVGVYEGRAEFTVNYAGRCTACGLTFDYEFSTPIPLGEKRGGGR